MKYIAVAALLAIHLVLVFTGSDIYWLTYAATLCAFYLGVCLERETGARHDSNEL